MGARRFSGLGIPPSAGPEFDANASRTSGTSGTSRDKDFTTPGSTPAGGGGSGAGDDGVPLSAEDTSGHFFAGFGEGLTTKSPVVYFMKTKHTGEDDCKTPINPHQASVLLLLLLLLTDRRSLFVSLQSPPVLICCCMFPFIGGREV